MNDYKVKRLPNAGRATQAQVIRVNDGQEMLSNPYQLSIAKRYAEDMNKKNDMGIYLIGLHNE